MKPPLSLTGQLSRFSVVGIANTVVDFGITNLLYLCIQPARDLTLIWISITACALATVNSYWLNSRWTFSSSSAPRSAAARFLATAGVGMAVNTAMFLFLMRHLLFAGIEPGLVAVNIARLGGVLTAMIVTFAGYRLWAFSPRTATPVEQIQKRGAKLNYKASLATIIALGLAVRLAFALFAPVLYGDAVNYTWVARLTATGNLQAVDLFWHSLFEFWQVPFVWLGFGHYSAPVISSLLPGLAIIFLVAEVTRTLFGRLAGLLAGLLAALHPRLIEYSLNGYAETFYLAGALIAVWGLIVLSDRPGHRGAVLAAGIGLATWLLVRNEALLFAFAAVALAVYTRKESIRSVLGAGASVALVAVVIFAAYALANTVLWGETAIGSKTSNLGRAHTEMTNLYEAARETYGAPLEEATAGEPRNTTMVLLRRWPENLRYVAERLPGVLLSPVFLFALLLPFLPGRARARAPVWPLVAFAVWPLVFYPLIQLEPRMLFPTLIGAIVFGSEGLLVAGSLLRKLAPGDRHIMDYLPAAAVTLLLVPLVALLAAHTEAERGYHREIGHWIESSVEPTRTIVGDGYGYVSASAFWAGRQALPRPWTDSSAELADYVGADGVLILYEGYVREANPELLATFDDGIPGMERVKEFEFARVGRVEVWQPVFQRSAHRADIR